MKEYHGASQAPSIEEELILSVTDMRRLAFSDAVKNNEIWPAFQPIVVMNDHALIGFEILARWNSPVYGNITPDTFIPWAEEDGLLDALTYHLITSACKMAQCWPGDFYLAFNISPLQFNNCNLVSMIFSAVSESGFPLARVRIEMTESAAISESPAVRALLERLGHAGVSITLDDFGTGYASLTRLRDFPFKTLKIDRGFVRNIANESSNQKIVSAIIGLGTSLGLEIIAEGVEDIEQATILQSLGCVVAQGWHYGREMAQSDASSFASDRTSAVL